MKILGGAGILLALSFVGLVVWLVVWYNVEHLGQIGAFLSGLGTLIIAVGGAGAVLRYFQERDQQVVQDLVRTAGDTVTLASQRFERAAAAGSPDTDALLRELEDAEQRQRAVLEGLMLRRELRKARYELVRTYVKDLTPKLEQERRRR